MAKRQAKAALATQALEVTGVDKGTSTITVESVSDATKKDSIEVEVLDISIDTDGIGQDLKVGETKTDKVVISGGTLPDSAVYEWFATYDSGQEGSFTFKQSADGKSCDLTGVTAGGGGRIGFKVTVDGSEWTTGPTGGSRVNVIPAEDLEAVM
ncbi:hypothetical protein [Escherichia phage PJNS034]